ncbi:MAG: replicative superfamily II helicase [Rubritalea sp.]|jgi:replicative superfamily II helicase
MKYLTLARLKNTKFPEIWERFVTGNYEENDELLAIKLTLTLTSCEGINLKRLGYRLALLHAYYSKDFSLIHALASSQGLAPIIKSIESKSIKNSSDDQKENDSAVSLIRESLSTILSEGDITHTIGQRIFQDRFTELTSSNLSVVAPTSYGKSSLITNYLTINPGNTCIIVPTKSLLSQTRRTLVTSLSNRILDTRKIITHHEMYESGDKDIIAVLTQERFLKLLQENKECDFKYIFVDESHNLFSNDSRSRALASSIILSVFRNPSCVVKFLSPFIAQSSNLLDRISEYKLETLETAEYLKSERIFSIDFRVKLTRYNRLIFYQFMGREYLYDIVTNKDIYSYLVENSGDKNIVYLNKPTSTHEVGMKLALLMPNLESPEIDKACEHLSSFLHKNYLLIKLLRKGIICHHGSIPESVRSYLEKIYRENEDVKFVITTSTLLEGVNIPASKMFILSGSKGRRALNRSQTKNGSSAKFVGEFWFGEVS